MTRPFVMYPHKALRTPAAAVDKITDEIRHAFPLAREARLLRHRIVTDPNSVFSVQPEVNAIRPSQTTKLPWFHLAGDWTATGWPATMEGAVISGRKVANAIAQRMVTTYSHEFLTPPLQPGWLAKLLIR